jgi:hypothetical protein
MGYLMKGDQEALIYKYLHLFSGIQINEIAICWLHSLKD